MKKQSLLFFIFIGLIYSSLLTEQTKEMMTDDFMLNEEEQATIPKAPLIKTPLVPATPLAPQPPLSKQPVPTTKQGRQEQEILQTFEELKAIADSLTKINQTPEVKKIVETKTKEQEKKEKEAEQRRKQREGFVGWKPSRDYSAPYSSSPGRSGSYYGGSGYGGGGYGGGGYGGGYGGSSYSPSNYGTMPGTEDSYTADDVKHNGDKDHEKDSLREDGKEKDKKDSDEMRKVGKLTEDKNIAKSYDKITQEIKLAANKADAMLKDIAGKPDNDAATALLRPGNNFTKLNQLLERAAETKSTLIDKEKNLQSIRKSKKDTFKKEEDRLSGLLERLFRPTLYAATLSDDEGFDSAWSTEQKAAQQLLCNSFMKKHIDEEAINIRAGKLVSNWESKNNTLIKQNTTNLKHLKQGTRGSIPHAGPAKQNLADLAQYFFDKKNEIESIINNFPFSKVPNVLKAKANELDKLLTQVSDVLPEKPTHAETKKSIEQKAENPKITRTIEISESAAANYDNAVAKTKDASEALQTILNTATATTDVNQGAIELLRTTHVFGQLNTLLNDITTLKEAISDDDMKKIKASKKDALAIEEDRLQNLLQKSFKPILQAATLDRHEGFSPIWQQEQNNAQSLLKNYPPKYIDEEAIAQRAKNLLQQWETRNKKQIEQNEANLTILREGTYGPLLSGPQTTGEIGDYFNEKNNEIKALIDKFPRKPKNLESKSKELDQLAKLAKDANPKPEDSKQQ